MISSLRKSPIKTRLLQLSPALIMIGVFMIMPLLLMAYVSILERGVNGGVDWGTFSFDAYVQFLFEKDFDDQLVLNTDYLQIFMRSLGLALMTTVFALVLGFPTAFYMALQPQKYRNILVFLVTVPFWTNLLVRTYAWIILLRNGGLVETAGQSLGLIDGSLNWLYSSKAIAIGLTYSFLPFMVLPIYASLEKLDFRLIEAAYDLGANRYKAFKKVIIPLASPGIIAGSLLVFIPCLGAYVTPELLGGSKTLMIGNLIQGQFGSARNWPFGAALAFVLLSFVILAMLLNLYVIKKRAAHTLEKEAKEMSS